MSYDCYMCKYAAMRGDKCECRNLPPTINGFPVVKKTGEACGGFNSFIGNIIQEWEFYNFNTNESMLNYCIRRNDQLIMLLIEREKEFGIE